MCIAICKPAGKQITDDQLKMCYISNSDGMGLAYNYNGKINIHKSLKYSDFVKKIRWVENKYPEANMLIHFRATTVGDSTLDNCHPFRINKHQVFIHNGTIKKVSKDVHSGLSDTAMFNKEILQKLPWGWENNSGIRKLIEQFICIEVINDGKICVLNSSGEFTIFNESEGHWFNGIWWSNNYYKKKRTSSYGVVAGATTYARDQNLYVSDAKLAIFMSRNDEPLKELLYIDPEEEEEKPAIHLTLLNAESVECEWCQSTIALADAVLLQWDMDYHICSECEKEIRTEGLWVTS